MKLSAAEILKKLRVRSGLQMTTHVCSRDPFVTVDFLYDRIGKTFALRLSWPNKSKTIALPITEVQTKSKSQWMTERTYTLTDACISRLAPGLDVAINAVTSRVKSG